jgi:2-keto-4-pentenoate hydratase
VVQQAGQIMGTGAGGAALGSPLNALVWLANTVGPLGVVLEPGSVILPGSITAAIPVVAGDSVTATFAGLGSVTACFSATNSIKDTV